MGNSNSAEPTMELQRGPGVVVTSRKTTVASEVSGSTGVKGAKDGSDYADAPDGQFVYKDEVTMHGIRDVIASPVKWHRFVWLAVMVAALVAMCIQLKQVTDTYTKDKVGTNVASYVPEYVPSVMFCPRFRYVKSEAETGVSEDVFNFINGFLPQTTAYSRKSLVDAGKIPNPAADPSVVAKYEAMKRAQKHSFTDMMHSIALDTSAIIREVDPFPPVVTSVADVQYQTLVTSAGYCYMVELKTKLSPSLAEYVGFKVFLHDNFTTDKHDGKALYYAYLGDFGSMAIQPPLSGGLQIFPGEQSWVKVRVTKKVRYPGRDKTRCRNYDRSDEKHCKSEVVNDRFCDYCQLGTMASTSYPESLKPNTTGCNLYTHVPCLFVVAAQPAKMQVLQEMCPVPCEEWIYDRTVDVVAEATSVVVMLDGLAFSTLIEEYPLLTLSDYLSNLGGTMGLYFGASLLSFVQLAFYCFGTPCCCAGLKMPWGWSSRRRGYAWT